MNIRFFLKNLAAGLLFLTGSLCSTAQYRPPEAFFTGLDLMGKDAAGAKAAFAKALGEDNNFHGSWHFLGVLFLNDMQYDSAIIYLGKAIGLNKENINHTTEMSYVRLTDAYFYKKDFENSFNTGWKALQLYPENKAIAATLRDLCLWAFHVKFNDLSTEYISPVILKEYTVRSVPEEYMIVRKLKSGGHGLSVEKQSLGGNGNSRYDLLTCAVANTEEKVTLKFKLGWDFEKHMGGHIKTAPQKVYGDAQNKIYERAGAKLLDDRDADLKTVIEKLQ